jgi:putative transposase
MAEYRETAHAVTDIKYHLVWITKYRYKILRGEIAERARALIRQICEARDVTIIRGAISADHVHMLVAAPPQLAPSNLVQYIKGR